MCEKTLMKLVTPIFRWVFSTSGRGLPTPQQMLTSYLQWKWPPYPKQHNISTHSGLSTSSEGISPALPAESNDLPQGSCHERQWSGPTSTTLLASRTATKLKCQQIPKGEVQSVTSFPMERCNIPQNYLNFLTYTSRNPGNMCANGY